MNTLIFVVYVVPLIIGLCLQGWAFKNIRGENNYHLVYFLALWVPFLNVTVVVFSLLALAGLKFFKGLRK